jgi:hypothetical protein
VRILKDFKSNEFVSADCKGVTGAFFVSMDSKEVGGNFREVWRCRGAFGGGCVLGRGEGWSRGTGLMLTLGDTLPVSYGFVKEFLGLWRWYRKFAFRSRSIAAGRREASRRNRPEQ